MVRLPSKSAATFASTRRTWLSGSRVARRSRQSGKGGTVGNIQTRSDRDGYIARWRDADNRRRSKSFRTKGEAQRFLVQIEAAKVQGDYIDPHRSKMTVETWAVEFRRLRARGPPALRRLCPALQADGSGRVLRRAEDR